jgi:hypothetical protein
MHADTQTGGLFVLQGSRDWRRLPQCAPLTFSVDNNTDTHAVHALCLARVCMRLGFVLFAGTCVCALVLRSAGCLSARQNWGKGVFCVYGNDFQYF